MSLILNKNIGAGEVVQDALNNGELLKAPSQNIVFDQLALKIASSEKGSANGVATLDANSLIPIAQIPPAALERLVVVADQAARFALTTATVQLGDTVKQTDTGVLYLVKDEANLANAGGYEAYTAASSVNFSGSLSGDVTGTQSSTAIAASVVTGKLITGFVSGSGTVAATDTILQSINKLDGNVAIKLNSSAFTDAAVTGKLITGYASGAGTVAATDSILQAIQKLNGNQSAAVPAYGKQSFALSAGDITNQYVDLLQVVKASSVGLIFKIPQEEGLDYSVSLTGGAGGKTRISFIGDLGTGGASELIATDRIVINYVY